MEGTTEGIADGSARHRSPGPEGGTSATSGTPAQPRPRPRSNTAAATTGRTATTARAARGEQPEAKRASGKPKARRGTPLESTPAAGLDASKDSPIGEDHAPEGRREEGPNEGPATEDRAAVASQPSGPGSNATSRPAKAPPGKAAAHTAAKADTPARGKAADHTAAKPGARTTAKASIPAAAKGGTKTTSRTAADPAAIGKQGPDAPREATRSGRRTSRSAEAGSPKPPPPVRKARKAAQEPAGGRTDPAVGSGRTRPARAAESRRAATGQSQAGDDTSQQVGGTPAVLEELVVADLPETVHIDEQLVEVARASVTELEVVPAEATELEVVPAGAEIAEAGPADLDSTPQPDQRVPLWARIVADPGFAAEHAAREVVDRLGPEARDWLARTRARYPSARPAGLARLATDESVRHARRQGAASGAAGVFGSAAAAGLVAGRHARLVLTIAGAYGFDPTAKERARELLVVLRVPRLTQPAPAALRNVARMATTFAVHRLAARVAPFGAAVAGATIGARSTRDVADRAAAHYRDGATHKKLR